MKFELLYKESLVNHLIREFRNREVSHVNLKEYKQQEWDSQVGVTLEEHFDPSLVSLDDLVHTFEHLSFRGVNTLIGLTSLVRKKNGLNVQMPQLEIDVKPETPELFFEYVKSIKQLFPNCQDAYVVASGKGYHFYGTQPMTLDAWTDFMKDVSKRRTLIDKGFIEMSLSRGYSNLRLTANNYKPTLPTLLGKITTN